MVFPKTSSGSQIRPMVSIAAICRRNEDQPQKDEGRSTGIGGLNPPRSRNTQENLSQFDVDW